MGEMFLLSTVQFSTSAGERGISVGRGACPSRRDTVQRRAHGSCHLVEFQRQSEAVGLGQELFLLKDCHLQPERRWFD